MILAPDINVQTYLLSVHISVQVTDLITDVHRSLADCVFCAGAQVGLGRADLLLLLGRLSEEKSLGADGAMSDVAVVLTMSALYAIDVRILEQEDADGMSYILSCVSSEQRSLDSGYASQHIVRWFLRQKIGRLQQEWCKNTLGAWLPLTFAFVCVASAGLLVVIQ